MEPNDKRIDQNLTTATSPSISITPVFPNCDHCIIFCVDDNYLPLASVAIQSIIDHNSTDEHYDVLVLYNGINNAHIHNIQRQCGNIENFRIRFVDIAPIFDSLKLHTKNCTKISTMSFCRLAIPWILSSKYTKAVYLDSDTVIRRDLAPIFDFDIHNSLIGAVRDYCEISTYYKRRNQSKLSRFSQDFMVPDIDDYVNASTLLLNVGLWKERLSLEKIFRICASRKWNRHAHDVVNALCTHQITYLPRIWSMQECLFAGDKFWLPDELLRDADSADAPVIIHFGGAKKPHTQNYVNYDLDFWRSADKTIYMADLLNHIESYEYRNYVVRSINKDKTRLAPIGAGPSIDYKGVALGQLGQGWQRFRVIRINNQVLHLEGALEFFDWQADKKMTILLSMGDRDFTPIKIYPERAIETRLKDLLTGYGFVFDIPLSNNVKKYFVKLKAFVNEKEIHLSRIKYSRFAELSGEFANEYYTNNGWTVRSDNSGTSIIVTQNTTTSYILNEYRFLLELLKSKKPNAKKAIAVRFIAHILKLISRKPIWLVSDRRYQAGDCGEVFYQFLKEKKRKEVKAYFLLTHSSKDYSRLKSLGGVVAPYSIQHRILALLAEWSISSQAEVLSRDPFSNNYFRSMIRKTRFAFTQHGVVSDDLTNYLDKDSKEIDGLVTSTTKEYDNFIKGEYHYTDKHIWLTGLPRFDRLENEPAKTVTILPTWRRYLFSDKNSKTGLWHAIDGFENSTYVSFYRNLLKDITLRNVLRKYGYSLRFLPHPSCSAYSCAFQIPEDSTFPENTSYQEIYKTSSLIVTDYSSSIYDFVYLKKPVVYCQFDVEQYFSGQHTSRKGNFDYERDGFGEVTYNIADLIDAISNYLRTDCALHEPYKTRIENAFPDREPTHCERLFKMIRDQGKY